MCFLALAMSQEQRPVRQSKSACWTTRSAYIPSGSAADRLAYTRSRDAGCPDSARAAIRPARNRSMTAVPKDRTPPAYPARTEDQSIRVSLQDVSSGPARAPSANTSDSESSKKGAYTKSETNKTEGHEAERSHDTVKYGEECKSDAVDVSIVAATEDAFTEQENTPENIFEPAMKMSN